MIGNEDIKAAKFGDGRRYQFSSGLCGREIALDRAAVFRPALTHKGIGLLFSLLIVEYNSCAGRGEQPNRCRPNSS